MRATALTWLLDKNMYDGTLNVLQVTGTMNRGGAEVMLMNIYRNLSPDVRFDFLINVKNNNRSHGDFDNEIVRLGGRLLYIGTQWDLWVVEYIRQFRKIIQDIGKPDVVHIHMNAKCGVIALAARICGIKKIIAHSHAALKFNGPFFQTMPNIVELKLQKVLIGLFATDFWGCSKEANASLFYQRFIRKNKTVVLNNAVDVSAFQNISKSQVTRIYSSYGIKENTLVLGNVGRVVRHKKVDFIIDVLKVLRERNMDFLFVFAGRVDDKAYMDEIICKARECRVEDRVLHLGDRDDIPAVMTTFDVFIGPALNEGFGLVSVEAQAAGVPCVLSKGFPPNVDMGLNLITYIDNYHPEKWADAILKASGTNYTNQELIWRKIAECGFDAAENAKAIEKLYRS
jgi:glycosyltransferase EpsF